LVREKVDVLEKRAANSRLRGVENAYSYLRSLLRNGDTVTEGEAPAADTAAQAPNAPAPPLSSAPLPESEWLNRRIDQIKAEILGLTPEQRKVYVDMALQELAENRMLTAVVSRRAAQGDVLHGLLGSQVVKHYASRMYGQDWNRTPVEEAP
jgi:hypothetical protein